MYMPWWLTCRLAASGAIPLVLYVVDSGGLLRQIQITKGFNRSW